jgi:hypothetical protein
MGKPPGVNSDGKAGRAHSVSGHGSRHLILAYRAELHRSVSHRFCTSEPAASGTVQTQYALHGTPGFREV